MRTRNLSAFATAAVLSLTLVAGAPAASAQNVNYGVLANVITGGTPGAYATYSNYLTGQTSVYSESDPAGVQWVYNLNQLLYSDAESAATTEIGSLSGQISTLAQRVAATNFPAGVTASTDGRFNDSILVASDTLPKGTPVALTFRAAVAVDWQADGLRDATVSCTFTAANVSVRSQWVLATDVEPAPVQSPVVTLNTQVGARFSVSGRLNTFARASFFAPGPRYDGNVTLDATCDTVLDSASADIYLVADSGHDYAAGQN